MNENVKRGRGRPKGSVAPNTLDIPVEDLLSIVREKGLTSIKVSRTWFLELDKHVESPKIEDAKIEFNIS